jgi:hypothetical protein
MSKLLVSLWLVVSTLTGVTTVAAAKPRPTTARPISPQSLEEQLANYLTYPNALGFSTTDRVLVIRFRVSEDHRLVRLNVFSNNNALNDDLIRQLTGTKLALPATDPEQVYTVRLHFAANL